MDEERRNSLRSSQIELEKEIQKDLVNNYTQADRYAAALKVSTDQPNNINAGDSMRKSSTSSEISGNSKKPSVAAAQGEIIEEHADADKENLIHKHLSESH